MWFLSKQLAVWWVLALCIASGQTNAERKGATSAIRLGYVNLDTAKAQARGNKQASFVGGVVVRFFDQTTRRESFALTNEYGTALVPLRPGTYCAEAYGTQGQRLRMDTWPDRSGRVCFQLKSDETKDVGLTLAHDEDYKPTAKSVGVD